MTDYLAWTDVETTGLSAGDDELLEIAVIITTADTLKPVAEPFHAVIAYPESVVQTMRTYSHEKVIEMHEKSGLWDRLSGPDARPRREVDRALVEYIQKNAPGKVLRLAGNSIRLDLNFVEEHLPLSYEFFHYRSVDVTAICYALEQRGLYYPPEAPEPAHEALADIKASIAQLDSALEQVEDRIRESFTDGYSAGCSGGSGW